MKRWLLRGVLVALIGLGLVLILWQRDVVDPLRAAYRIDAPVAPTRVLVVLDTVRADRLSLCGYARPTSPVLESLGGSHSCDAIAPGSWTLPSHASFFTGLSTPEHGAHSLVGGEALGLATAETVRPLRDEPTTLAERFAERGYQSISVSGNPVVSPPSGLTRGFDSARHPELFGELYGPALVEEVRDALRFHADPERPLFLFVNIADAHMPWWEVPEGIDWVPARPALAYGDSGLWEAWFQGRATPGFLDHLGDVYDYGVFRADETLGAVLDALDAYGWYGPKTRLVVTSDHGEFLGEHGLIDHGHYVHEENVRVPLVLVEEGAAPLPVGPISAGEVFDLVLDGTTAGRDVTCAAYPHSARFDASGSFGETSAARWSPATTESWTLSRGFEATPTPLFEGYVEDVQRSAIATGSLDPALEAALEAAGYL